MARTSRLCHAPRMLSRTNHCGRCSSGLPGPQGARLASSAGARSRTSTVFSRRSFFPAAGLHGAEIRFPDTSRNISPNDGAMDCVRQPLADFVAAHPGLRLEDKGAALAVHYRQTPELAGDVLEF